MASLMLYGDLYRCRVDDCCWLYVFDWSCIVCGCSLKMVLWIELEMQKYKGFHILLPTMNGHEVVFMFIFVLIGSFDYFFSDYICYVYVVYVLKCNVIRFGKELSFACMLS